LNLENLSCKFCGSECCLPQTAEQMRANGADATTIKAYELKDRLLLFDREHAQRTRVYDAQGDYYSSSTWLTDKEREDIERKEQQKIEGKQKATEGRKISLNVDSYSSHKKPSVIIQDVDNDGEYYMEPDIVPTTSAQEKETEDDELITENEDYTTIHSVQFPKVIQSSSVLVCKPGLDERDDSIEKRFNQINISRTDEDTALAENDEGDEDDYYMIAQYHERFGDLENYELESKNSKAAEAYRIMRKRFETFHSILCILQYQILTAFISIFPFPFFMIYSWQEALLKEQRKSN
jgi:hypothetical protein